MILRTIYSYSNQESVILVNGKTHRSIGCYKEPRYQHKQIRPTDFWYSYKCNSIQWLKKKKKQWQKYSLSTNGNGVFGHEEQKNIPQQKPHTLHKN